MNYLIDEMKWNTIWGLRLDLIYLIMLQKGPEITFQKQCNPQSKFDYGIHTKNKQTDVPHSFRNLGKTDRIRRSHMSSKH